MAKSLFALKGKRISHYSGWNGTLNALCIKDIAISGNFLHFIGEKSFIIMEIPIAFKLIKNNVATFKREIDHCIIEDKYTLSL